MCEFKVVPLVLVALELPRRHIEGVDEVVLAPLD